MGHLLTAAAVHHRITGQRNFLEIAIKQADYSLRPVYAAPAGAGALRL